MAVDSRHPLYDDMVNRWNLMVHSLGGQEAIKAQQGLYLPPTQGMYSSPESNSLSVQGARMYAAYLERALYPDVVKTAQRTMLGIMHRKPAKFTLPKKLQPYLERFSRDGEGLQQFLRRINQEQLGAGRTGLMLDLPSDPSATGPENLPYCAMYDAKSIINWDAGTFDPTRRNLNLVVLNESGPQRSTSDGFDWEEKKRHLVLSLGEFDVNEGYWTGGDYKTAIFNETNAQEGDTITPMYKGKALPFIPFTFVNPGDLLTSPDEPPLLGLANLAVAIYRLEADYRQALFLQGQATLFITGEPDTSRVFATGAGAVIIMQNPQAQGKWLSVDGAGLQWLADALSADKSLAASMSSQLADTSRTRESGDALKTRVGVGAQTASITQVAQTGAAGLTSSLKQAAFWVGADPDEVKVEPNMQFTDSVVTPRVLVEFATAKQMGVPISETSIHRYMKKHGLTEMDLEEELEAIDSEEPRILPGAGAGAELSDVTTKGDEQRQRREDDPTRENNDNAAE